MDVVVTRVRVRSTFNAIMWGAMSGNRCGRRRSCREGHDGEGTRQIFRERFLCARRIRGGQDSAPPAAYEAFGQEVAGSYVPEAAGGSKNRRNSSGRIFVAIEKRRGAARAGRPSWGRCEARIYPALAGECALISASTMSEWPFGSTLSQCLTILPSGPIRKVWRLASSTPGAGLHNTPYCFDHFLGRVGQDVERQAVFLGEFLVRGDVVDAHAEDHGIRLAEREDVVAQLSRPGWCSRGCNPSGRNTAPPTCPCIVRACATCRPGPVV